MPRPLRRVLTVSPLAVLAVAYPLLHKPVSDVFDWASGRWGFAAYQRGTLIGIPLVCALAVLPFIARRWSALLRPRQLSALITLVAAKPQQPLTSVRTPMP